MWNYNGFVEFSVDERLRKVYDLPVEARKRISEKYKSVPNKIVGRGLPKKTVRGCMPFFDAMTLGYIVPLPYDILLISQNGGTEVELFTPSIDAKEFGLDGEPATAVTQNLMGNISPYPIIKLESPFWIRTSNKSSALVTDVCNQFNYLRVVSGLIDTDRIDTKLKFFVFWTGPDGEHLIKAGTPLAQVIPHARKRYRLKNRLLSSEEVERRSGYQRRSIVDSGIYKRLYRDDRDV